MGLETIAAIAAIGSAGYSIYSGERAARAQDNAQKQAMAQAKAQEEAADQAANKANRKQPDTSALLSAAAMSGKGGLSGTMLTGPAGVDPNTLSLGKTTLLGG